MDRGLLAACVAMTLASSIAYADNFNWDDTKLQGLYVRSEDWPDIDQGIINLDMSQCAVIAAWALPTEWENAR